MMAAIRHRSPHNTCSAEFLYVRWVKFRQKQINRITSVILSRVAGLKMVESLKNHLMSHDLDNLIFKLIEIL